VVLDLGGLYALYLTGAYQAAEHNDLVHAAVHMHMFLAGCLFSWAVIGIDPDRRRPGRWVRLTALIIAAAGHDTLSKLIYAWNLPVGGGPIASRHTGAELMYYGGTVIEVALAAIVMAQWYLISGRALARTRRRAGQGDQPDALAADQGLYRRYLLFAAHQRGQRHRQRLRRRHRISAGLATRRPGPGEPLAQQHRQVVLNQTLQVRGVGKALVGSVALVPDPGEQLRQPGLAVGCRCLDVQQPGSPVDSRYSSSSPEICSPGATQP
jgi:hypothetical protein